MSVRFYRALSLVGIAALVWHVFLPATVEARSTTSGSHSQNTSSVQGGQATGATSSSNIQSPRDTATGQASGKRQHKPINVIKEWGTSSPN
jgi:hypothetical protein